MRLTQMHKLLLFLCFTGFVGSAFGSFSIDPAVITVRLDRGENSAWLDVVHVGSNPIAVELAVFERHLTMDGELVSDTLIPSGDFVVYPAQLILTPREQARVQVVYKGRQRGAVDKAYLLRSKEVPLRIEEGGEGVRTGLITLMEYYSILAVSAGKHGRLAFVSSRSIGDGKIEVIVENKSQGRVQLDRMAVIIGGKDRITNFTGKKNSVMPGQQRRLTFEYSRPVTAREITFGP